MKEVTINAYQAEDGAIFYTKAECENYGDEVMLYKEELAKRKEKNKKDFQRIMSMRAISVKKDIRYTVPISCGDIPNSLDYMWFKVNTQEDFDFLNKFVIYECQDIEEYPAYICVELECADEEGFSEMKYPTFGVAAYSLDGCIRDTKIFFDKFGYKVNIEKDKSFY